MPCLRSRSPCLELETSLYSNIDFRNTPITGETFFEIYQDAQRILGKGSQAKGRSRGYRTAFATPR